MEWMEITVLVLELVGVAAFSVSGSLLAIDKNLDILGILVLGVITALGGGMIRDILLGITPPILFQEPIYVIIAAVASAAVFLFARFFPKTFDKYHLWNRGAVFNLIDAVGLGIFAVLGVDAAISSGHGGNAFLTIFVGTLSGAGGGLLRDIMACQIPAILRKHVYALAAVAGAGAYYIMYCFNLNRIPAIFLGACLTVLIRLMAAHFEWRLPRIERNI